MHQAPKVQLLLSERWPKFHAWLDEALTLRSMLIYEHPAAHRAHYDRLYDLAQNLAKFLIANGARDLELWGREVHLELEVLARRLNAETNDYADDRRFLTQPRKVPRAGTSTNTRRADRSSTRKTQSKRGIFHFALNGEHVRGNVILKGSIAELSFNYGLPGTGTLTTLRSARLADARVANSDITLDISTTGGVSVVGANHGVARFRDGRMQVPVMFMLDAHEVGCFKVHVDFGVRGETVHQSELEVSVVAGKADIDEAPVPVTGQQNVPDLLLNEVAGSSVPPEQRIRLSLGYDGGRFCIDLQDLIDGEICFTDRFVSVDIDSSKLDNLFKLVREELAPSYSNADFWTTFDGTAAAAAGLAARRTLARTLGTLAAAGWVLNSGLSKDVRIGEALSYVEQNGRLGATITVVTDDIFVPWEIIYGAYYAKNMTDDERAESPPKPNLFWGARFAIETLQRGGISLGKLRADHQNAQPRVSVNFNPTIVIEKVPEGGQPLALLRRWAEQLSKDGYLDGVNEGCKEIRGVLQRAAADANIIYVYCHGGPPSAVMGTSEFLQLDANCELRPIDLNPDVRFKNAPIIVLNACQVGAISPVTLSNFLKEFRARGALGLISATGSIPILFGAHFGEELVQCCLDRTGSLAGAVLALRNEHLKRGNPVPLLYSVQCPI